MLLAQLDDLHVRVQFGVVDSFTVMLIVRTTVTGRFVKDISSVNVALSLLDLT